MPAAKILPVIKKARSGTRLCPFSTGARPKQFHDLGSDRSMIVEAALRVLGSHGEFAFLDPVIIADAIMPTWSSRCWVKAASRRPMSR